MTVFAMNMQAVSQRTFLPLSEYEYFKICTALEIHFWSLAEVYEAMKHTYQEIHMYKDEDFYGEAYEPTKQSTRFPSEEKRKLITTFCHCIMQKQPVRVLAPVV